jgi:hypothetical protein
MPSTELTLGRMPVTNFNAWRVVDMEIVCMKKAGKANIDKVICSWYTTENSSHSPLLASKQVVERR